MPIIPGLGRAKVFQADEVLAGKVKAEGKVAIIGGSNIGIELANFLIRQGTQISILEEKWVGRGIERFSRRSLIDRLIQSEVRVFPNVKICEVKADRVLLRNEEGKQESIEIDCIVNALPGVTNDGLVELLRVYGLQVLAINPCQSPRDYPEAALEGASIGRSI